MPAGAQIQTSEQRSCWAGAGSLHLEAPASPVSQRLILHVSEKLKKESDVAWVKARTRVTDRTQNLTGGKVKPSPSSHHCGQVHCLSAVSRTPAGKVAA